VFIKQKKIIENLFFFKVTIYFRNRLYRGNRVTKIDCEGLNAFESHNFPTLAEFRTKIQGIKFHHYQIS
jgi:L-asparaginase/Glu-tRNA(Gln) amidotransferase subunit D